MGRYNQPPFFHLLSELCRPWLTAARHRLCPRCWSRGFFFTLLSFLPRQAIAALSSRFQSFFPPKVSLFQVGFFCSTLSTESILFFCQVPLTTNNRRTPVLFLKFYFRFYYVNNKDPPRFHTPPRGILFLLPPYYARPAPGAHPPGPPTALTHPPPSAVRWLPRARPEGMELGGGEESPDLTGIDPNGLNGRRQLFPSRAGVPRRAIVVMPSSLHINPVAPPCSCIFLGPLMATLAVSASGLAQGPRAFSTGDSNPTIFRPRVGPPRALPDHTPPPPKQPPF